MKFDLEIASYRVYLKNGKIIYIDIFEEGKWVIADESGKHFTNMDTWITDVTEREIDNITFTFGQALNKAHEIWKNSDGAST